MALMARAGIGGDIEQTRTVKPSRYHRRWIVGTALFWIAVTAVVAGRVALFDQIAAAAVAQPQR